MNGRRTTHRVRFLRLVAVATAGLVLVGCTGRPPASTPSPSPLPSQTMPSPTLSQSLPPPQQPFSPSPEPAGGQPPHPVELPPAVSVPPLPPTSPGPQDGLIQCGEQTEVPSRGVRIRTKFTCYRINGRTAKRLNEQMRARGPVVDGKRAAASAEWSIAWGYSAEQTSTTCKVATADLRARITFSFPNWDPPKDAPADLVSRWEQFLAQVLEHEQRHKEIAVSGAREIRAAFLHLGTFASCDALGKRAQKEAREILARTRQRQTNFDRREAEGEGPALS